MKLFIFLSQENMGGAVGVAAEDEEEAVEELLNSAGPWCAGNNSDELHPKWELDCEIEIDDPNGTRIVFESYPGRIL